MKLVREVTIKELNAKGHKALFRGILDDKRQFGKDYGVMRKVLNYKPLEYNIRFNLDKKDQRKTKKEVVASVLATMLKNGCDEGDFEIILLEEVLEDG
jgi:hypothetical protein